MAVNTASTKRFLCPYCSNECKTFDGLKAHVVSEHESMWAYRKGLEDRLSRDVQARSSEADSQFLGTTLGLMNRPDGLFPPPSVWPVSTEVRWALLEEELVLVHLLDAAAFVRTSDGGESIEIDLSRNMPVLVTVENEVYPLALKFIYDVLYGFETVESCVDGLFQFARQLHQMSPPEVAETSLAKPVMHSVATIEEADAVLSPGQGSDNDLVAVAPQVYAHFKTSKETAKHGSHRAFVERADRGTYVIMTVGDLRELIRNAAH